MNLMKNAKGTLMVLFMLFFCLVSFAQTPISGLVKDASGEPIIGANVLVKGTTNGTITDFNGNFTLQGVTKGSTIEISYIGYLSQDVKFTGQSNLTITLKEDSKTLDEVVVVGYGVVKKRDLTGSVSSVKSSEITKVTTSNAMQAMQAKVPGLDIQQSSGQAGAGLNITLRGNRSINASNSPLILVDGVEYGSTIDISANDIESMEVLKDASSTAIYGTRGANGVIIITTKKGKAGKTNVNLNSYLSFNSPTFVPKIMYGTKEVQRLVDKANYIEDAKTGNWGSSKKTVKDVLGSSPTNGLPYSEIDVYNDGSYTDWADIVLQNGLTQNYDLSINGGNEKTTFNISLGTQREEGLLRNDKQTRYNGKISVDHNVASFMKVGADMLYTHKNHDKRAAGVFTRILSMTSIAHPYDGDGNIIYKPSPYYEAHANPLLDEVPGALDNNIESDRLFATGYIQLTPIKWLTIKSLLNVDKNVSTTGLYQDYLGISQLQGGVGSYISNENSHKIGYTWDNTINYMTDFGGSKNSLTLLAGSSTKKSTDKWSTVYGYAAKEHYYNSTFYDTSLILSPTNKSSYTKTSMQSYFGRVNYSYDSKYLLTASLRADGSSVLAKGHKWGYFPSVAAAWRISDEAFMQPAKGFLDDLKFRLSWGRTGNSAISAYQTLATVDAENQIYYTFGTDQVIGRIPTSLGNENLTWETTSSINVGLDFTFFNSRLYGSVDYYSTKTNDLLYARSLPISSVYSNVLSNIGKTKGHGFEAQIGGTPIKSSKLSWDSNLSFSTSKDEIVELSDGVDKNIVEREGQIVGQPVNIYYYYEADGCWGIGEFDKYKADWESKHPGNTLSYTGTTGDIKIIDRNDDGKIDEDDKKVYDRSPKCILGWNNTFSIADFTLSFLMYARLGGWMEYAFNERFTYDNSNWTDLDYWTPTNQGAKFPSPGFDKKNTYGSALLYEKASYLKIKDITLGYNVPKSLLSKVGLSNVKVYGSLKNFFTFSNIDNYDPEQGGSIRFPLAKQVVVGLNVGF